MAFSRICRSQPSLVYFLSPSAPPTHFLFSSQFSVSRHCEWKKRCPTSHCLCLLSLTSCVLLFCFLSQRSTSSGLQGCCQRQEVWAEQVEVRRAAGRHQHVVWWVSPSDWSRCLSSHFGPTLERIRSRWTWWMETWTLRGPRSAGHQRTPSGFIQFSIQFTNNNKWSPDS